MRTQYEVQIFTVTATGTAKDTAYLKSRYPEDFEKFVSGKEQTAAEFNFILKRQYDVKNVVHRH